ncbi:hypothetical protein V6N12_013775 [Hibiscus sabdariffa]|uniref:Uncharacterized protein n=1 Tax=Hibiscus sabdariffa TaxID=183260 RepID=A0ABR2CV76_9ROSI
MLSILSIFLSVSALILREFPPTGSLCFSCRFGIWENLPLLTPLSIGFGLAAAVAVFCADPVVSPGVFILRVPPHPWFTLQGYLSGRRSWTVQGLGVGNQWAIWLSMMACDFWFFLWVKGAVVFWAASPVLRRWCTLLSRKLSLSHYFPPRCLFLWRHLLSLPLFFYVFGFLPPIGSPIFFAFLSQLSLGHRLWAAHGLHSQLVARGLQTPLAWLFGTPEIEERLSLLPLDSGSWMPPGSGIRAIPLSLGSGWLSHGSDRISLGSWSVWMSHGSDRISLGSCIHVAPKSPGLGFQIGLLGLVGEAAHCQSPLYRISWGWLGSLVESRCVLVPGHWAGVFGHRWSIPCLINWAGGAYKAREPSIQVYELPALPPVAHPGPWVFHMRSPDHVNNGMQDLHEFPYFWQTVSAGFTQILTSLLPHNCHLLFPVQFPWFFLAVLFPAIPYPPLTLMDPELVHSMENLQFTEAESSSIVVDSPYEERDSALWLVGSVLTTKMIHGDSICRIFRFVWKSKNVSEIIELRPNFFLIKPVDEAAKDLILKRRPWTKPMAGPRKKSSIEYFDSGAPMKATAVPVGEATTAPVGKTSARLIPPKRSCTKGSWCQKCIIRCC